MSVLLAQPAKTENNTADKRLVERRNEPRIRINQEVTVTVLGCPDSLPFQAVAVEMSGRGMRLVSPRPVPYQAAITVETGDLLLLGEVIRVEGEEIVLKLEHSLSRLHQALSWENTTARKPTVR